MASYSEDDVVKDAGKLQDSHISEVSTNSTFASDSSHGDEKRNLWQNIKKYRKVVWITFAVSSAILLYGYDNVIVGTVSAMPRFQEEFGEKLDDEWILPSMWLALWNVASPIGSMMGAPAGGWFQDKVGRRTALGVTSFLSALSVAIMYASYVPENIDSRRACFFAGKFFQGAAIGGVMAAAQTYMSETIPTILRGSGMAFFPVFTLLGQLTGALVIFGVLEKKNGYSIAFGSQWPFSFVPVLVSFLIPESPVFYVRKRQMEKAHKAQARLDPPGVDTKAIVAKILVDIEHEESQAQATFKECFHRRNFRRTLIVMWANSLPAIFGLQLLAKASYFLQLINMKASTSIIFLILGIVLGLLANVFSVYLISRVGRRPLIVYSLLIAALIWLSMGIANCFKITPGVMWWTAASMMITIVVCGMSVWPASFAVAAETSALQLRAKTQGVGWMISAFTSAVAGLVLPYIFNPDEGNLRGKVGFVYVGACLAGAVISWFLVPEMKGRSIGEIDRMFELNLPARKFKSYKVLTSSTVVGETGADTA